MKFLKQALYSGTPFGIAMGFYYGLIYSALYGLFMGIVSGILFGCIMALIIQKTQKRYKKMEESSKTLLDDETIL